MTLGVEGRRQSRSEYVIEVGCSTWRTRSVLAGTEFSRGNRNVATKRTVDGQLASVAACWCVTIQIAGTALSPSNF